MNLDYEAARKVWADTISHEPEQLAADPLSLRQAKRIVDAAVPKPCEHGFRRSHPVWHGEVEESWGWEPRSPDVWCEGKSEADKKCECVTDHMTAIAVGAYGQHRQNCLYWKPEADDGVHWGNTSGKPEADNGILRMLDSTGEGSTVYEEPEAE